MANQFRALQSKLLTESLNKQQKINKSLLTIQHSKQNHLQDDHTGDNIFVIAIHF
jgi:hypothetical protein